MSAWFFSNAQDHPRGCGENDSGEKIDLYAQGSPPRMRGKPCMGYGAVEVSRITPADAGKTIRMPELARLNEDHPRGCGENVWVDSYQDAAMGSPPRMRGKHFANFRPHLGAGITPADAGKTSTAFSVLSFI